MKKILIALLAVLMLTACSTAKVEETQDVQEEQQETQQEEKENVGGWTINTNLPEMNDAIFDSARQGIDGASYSPLFVIGTQPVAGKNLMYLAYVTPVVPDAKPSFKVVTVFNDVENNPISGEITNVEDFDVNNYLDGEGSTTPEGLMGGWQDASELPNMLTDEENAVFEKALEGLVGVGYTPVATLAKQVVAGTNYAFLALGTTVTAEPVTHLYVINVYADLQGNATINNICGIDLTTFTQHK